MKVDVDKSIKIKAKHFYAALGTFGAVCSIASILISQAITQSSNGNYSPNIYGQGDVSVEIQSIPRGKDWFEEFEKNKPNISKKQFHSLKPGLTYQQVLDIVEIDGVLLSETSSGKNYAWGKTPFYYMYASFNQEGELLYAVNSGLF